MNISNILALINTALSGVLEILKPIPGFLLLCMSNRRPGIESILMAAEIFSNLKLSREDGFDDVLTKFIFNYVRILKENLQDDGVCLIVIPPNELKFQLTGGNAGGPIVLTGSNKNFVLCYGIIR